MTNVQEEIYTQMVMINPDTTKAITELGEAITELGEACKRVVEALGPAVRAAANGIAAWTRGVDPVQCARALQAINEAPPRVRHLALRGKKYRTRKKNLNRALREYQKRRPT